MTNLSPAQELVTPYRNKGFVLVKPLFDESELAQLQEVLERFHQRWQESNTQFFLERAINSAYLTDQVHLSLQDRRVLFRILGDMRIGNLLRALFPGPAAFINTQLFFNPVNSKQPNYWHRDIQYTDEPIAVQREELTRINVLHLRLALRPELGIELVPGSHIRWDTPLEYAVRMGQEGHKVYDALPHSECVALRRGELLIFSANMLHRGLYGGNRLAFDMVFSDPLTSLVKYVRPSCLPQGDDFATIENPAPFLETLRVREAAGL